MSIGEQVVQVCGFDFVVEYILTSLAIRATHRDTPCLDQKVGVGAVWPLDLRDHCCLADGVEAERLENDWPLERLSSPSVSPQ